MAKKRTTTRTATEPVSNTVAVTNLKGFDQGDTVTAEDLEQAAGGRVNVAALIAAGTLEQ